MGDRNNIKDANHILHDFKRNSYEQHKGNIWIQPKIVSLITSDDVQVGPIKNLKYLCLPDEYEYPIDMSKEKEISDRKGRYLTHNLGIIEGFLMKNKNYLQNTINICTQRTVLVNIIMLPYCKSDRSFLATKINNTICLAQKQSSQETDLLNCKFINLCFSDSPKEKVKKPLNASIQDYAVYQAKIGDMNLLYSAQVNGIISTEEFKNFDDVNALNELRFVQGKLKKQHDRNIKIKERKWYHQGLFAGTKAIVLGEYYSGHHIKMPIKVIGIDELKVKKTQSDLNFLHDILRAIVEKMSEADNSNVVFEFQYKRSTNCIHWDMHMEKEEYKFLTDDFIKTING